MYSGCSSKKYIIFTYLSTDFQSGSVRFKRNLMSLLLYAIIFKTFKNLSYDNNEKQKRNKLQKSGLFKSLGFSNWFWKNTKNQKNKFNAAQENLLLSECAGYVIYRNDYEILQNERKISNQVQPSVLLWQIQLLFN